MSASAEEMSVQVEQVVASAQGLDKMAGELRKIVVTFTKSDQG